MPAWTEVNTAKAAQRANNLSMGSNLGAKCTSYVSNTSKAWRPNGKNDDGKLCIPESVFAAGNLCRVIRQVQGDRGGGEAMLPS